MKQYLTTGEAAAVCMVAPRTVTKWCDAGLVACHRIPRVGAKGGGRRIDRGSLAAFLAGQGWPAAIVERINPGPPAAEA